MSANVRIILVQTSCSANIGAVARATKTMGLTELVLVDPQCEPFSLDAMAMAAGAQSVLLAAKVIPTLGEAVASCHFVAGASARDRALRGSIQTPRQTAETVQKLPADFLIALVFGREKNGLTNAELAHCQVHIQIPTRGNYTSLNLAQAVQIVSYELCQASLASSAASQPEAVVCSPNQAEIACFFDRVEQLLVELHLLNPASPKKLLPRLRRFLHRAQPDKAELDILQGIVSAIKNLNHFQNKT